MLLVAASVAISVMVPVKAWAEPYFAQREGYRCSKCHVNGTGGGMRTAFGRQWALTHLTMVGGPPPEDAVLEELTRPPWYAIDPVLNDFVAVGANVRISNETAFADEVQNTFGNPEANLYLALSALEFLTGYVDVSVAEGNVEAREAFVMLHRLSGFRLKAGVILLPYGLRIWGEDEFIRSETGFTYANPDLGIELGYEIGGFGVFLAISNGAGGGLDEDSDKKLSGTLEWAGKWLRVGASGSANRTSGSLVNLAGTHFGLTLGRLVLLGEADWIRTGFRGNATGGVVESFVAYAEANFLLLRGLNLKVAYGYHDPALDVSEDQRVHLRGGVEAFIIPTLGVNVYYDLRESVPQDQVGNADVLFAEIHFYL